MDLVLNLEELLYLRQSMKMVARIELLYVSYFSRNHLKVLISFPISFFRLLEKNSFMPFFIKGF